MNARENPLRALMCVVVVATIAFTTVVFAIRTAYPHDLEFMTGAMLDLAERVRDGGDLYREPGVSPTAFVYAPGWFRIVGFLGHFVSIRTGAKLVASLSAIGIVALIALLARRLGASWTRTAGCVALFTVGYAVTGGWYDVERVDLLATLWLLLATYVSAQETPRPAWAGVSLGLAVICKQTLVVAAFAFLARALALRRFRECLHLGLGLLVAPGLTWVSMTPDARRWMLHYCFVVPRAHGVMLSRTTLLATDFADAFLLTAATCVCLWVAVRTRAADSPLVAPLVGALAASVLSRLHPGGWPNVMTPWFVLAAVGAAYLPETGRWRHAVDLAFIGQLGLACSILRGAVPRAEHRRGAEHLAALVHALEERGDVWVLGRGHLTTRHHAHSVALGDLFRAGSPLPVDVKTACDNRTFAAIVIDDIDELFADPTDQWAAVIARNYRLVAGLEAFAPLPTGYSAVPRWLLVPRSSRFEGPADLAIADLRRSALATANAPSACLVDGAFDCRGWVSRTLP